MDKEKYIDLISYNWPLSVILIFLFGVGVGVLINRAMTPSQDDTEPRAQPADGEQGSLDSENGTREKPEASADRFGQIETEIAAAREALRDLGEDQQSAKEELDADEALKRANGRLKVILKSLKSANLFSPLIIIGNCVVAFWV